MDVTCALQKLNFISDSVKTCFSENRHLRSIRTKDNNNKDKDINLYKYKSMEYPQENPHYNYNDYDTEELYS